MRHSVEAAQWSETREKSYRSMAENIAFQANISLQVRGLNVFLTDQAGERLLITASQAKRQWYEAWLALTVLYPVLSQQ